MAFCFTHVPGIAWDEFDGEAVLVDAVSGKVCHLNSSASFIWKACRHGAETESIVRDLARTGHDRAQIRADVRLFMSELEALGMLSKDVKPQAPRRTSDAPHRGHAYVSPRITSEEVLGRPPRPASPNSVTDLPP